MSSSLLVDTSAAHLRPMDANHHDVTVDLVRSARQGDRAAIDRLFELAYGELIRRARGLRFGGAPATLNTTALVHEAYLKLRPDRGLDVADRAHFNYVMVRAMRQVLVDQARRDNAQKRGGGQALVTLHDQDGPTTVHPGQMIALDEALQRLASIDLRKSQVVECRFFTGLSVAETAEILEISEPTVKRDWRVARAWLAQELGEELGA